jgi:hypothetical protein
MCRERYLAKCCFAALKPVAGQDLHCLKVAFFFLPNIHQYPCIIPLNLRLSEIIFNLASKGEYLVRHLDADVAYTPRSDPPGYTLTPT